MAGKVKTWVWIVVGIAVVGILFVLAMAGAGIYYFTRNIDARTVSTEAAAGEFDAVRARFSGQKPLIELDESGGFVKSNVDRPTPAGARQPEALYVLAFDPDDGGPGQGRRCRSGCCACKTGGATVNFNDHSMNLEDLKLTVEDLERFGPTLVLDQTNRGGDRVLVWSQ